MSQKTVKIFNILIRKDDYIIRYFLGNDILFIGNGILFFYKCILRYVEVKHAVEHQLSKVCGALLWVYSNQWLYAHMAFFKTFGT